MHFYEIKSIFYLLNYNDKILYCATINLNKKVKELIISIKIVIIIIKRNNKKNK